MRETSRLDVYSMAYLCGGPERVAMVVLAGLCADGRIKISSARHRVSVVRPAPRDAVETAVLDAIPNAGMVLGPAVQSIAGSPAVQEIGRTLTDRGLLPRSRLSALWQWGRVMRGRRVRRRLARRDDQDGLGRVAVRGTPGIADDTIRRIFETPDPPPPIKVPRMGRDKMTNPYSGIGTSAPFYDGGGGGGGGGGD
jgi:hypothetical protein